MSMYSTCDSKNNDRMGRTESVEDTLLSPTRSAKENRFPRYSNSKYYMEIKPIKIDQSYNSSFLRKHGIINSRFIFFRQ